MKAIGQILKRYTAWILGLLKVLSLWGPFVIAFADSALLGMPVDAIVATYVYQDRKRMILYIVMAALGSALGSVPLYIIGYVGGEKVLRKRISEATSASIICRVTGPAQPMPSSARRLS